MTRLMFALAAGLILAAAQCAATSAVAADAILLDFSSPHCGHCEAMKPTLAQLARTGVAIRHVDVTTEPQLASRFGVRKTPTYIVLSGGKEITRLVGAQPLDQLRAALEIDPHGNLIPTRATGSTLADLPAPQTSLAPVGASLRGPSNSGPTAFATPARLSAPSFARAATPAAHTRQSIRSEAMPSVSLADAVERARAATVRLRVHDGHGYGAGTGTIIDTHGDEALVLTCGHLFRETKGQGKIEVDLFVGGQTRTVAGEVVDYDADTRDIALVVIRPGFAVQPVKLLNGDDPVQSGQSAFSFGCDRGDDPSRRDTRITGVNKYNQHLGVSNLEIAGAPIDGRSGGGLFDASGRLIGVCNAADYQGDVGIYAGPGNVQWQLDRVGLSHLYQSTVPDVPQPASPPDRLASLAGDSQSLPESAVQPSTLTAAQTTSQPIGSSQEVIVIVRDRNNPGVTSKVMTLANPSADLMRQIELAQ